MNILLTSVGRRAYLVRYFQEALKGKGEVHVCNSSDVSVAFKYADKSVVSPLIYDVEYIPFLLNYCKKNRIDILLSLFDIDLPILTKNKEQFEKIGTRVIVSNLDFVEICNDKWKTYQFLKKNNIRVPKTYLSVESVFSALDSGEMEYPIIVKPRFGCGSIGLAIADNEMSVLQMFRKILKDINNSYLRYESSSVKEKVIFQELLYGQEYGVDVINDLNGNFQNAIIKKKIAMRSGETDIAETVIDESIYKVAKRIAELSGHIGNLDMDIFKVNGISYVLEMNARFGGGYPFSHKAGCNLPEAILKWCNGEIVDKELLQAESGILSFKEIIITSIKD